MRLGTKISLTAIALLLAGIGMSRILAIVSVRETAMLGLIEQARAFTHAAEEARQYMLELREKYNVFRDEELLQPESMSGGYWHTISVNAGMEIARRVARDSDFSLRVTRIGARNPANEATGVEAAMMKALEANQLIEYHIVDREQNVLRYMRAMRLTKDCLPCHGDPSLSKDGSGRDPFGYPMEGWRENELRGAFEVISPLAPVDQRVQTQVRQGLVVAGTLVLLASVCFALLTRWNLSRPIDRLVTDIEGVAAGMRDLHVEGCERRDEIGRIARAVKKLSHDLAETENRLVQAERMAAIGRIAAGINHEVRNCLGVIRSSVFALFGVLEPHPDARVQNHLRKIDRQAEKMLKIASNLLEFATSRRPRVERIALTEVLQASRAMVEQSPGIKVRLLVPAELSLLIDPQQMRAVFENLLINAVQAMAGEGTIEIEALDRQDHVEILVRDTGPGVTNEACARLFEPLFTTKDTGIGLGLAFCRTIVEAHHGTIELVKNGPPGATFRIVLPRIADHVLATATGNGTSEN